MTPLGESDIIYDWNSAGKRTSLAPGRFTFFDETLRDGIQSPSVNDPNVEDKLRIVKHLDAIGIDHVDIGLPGAGPRAVEDCLRLACFIRDEKLRIKAACAARTHLNDIRPIVEISQRAGVPIEVMTFIGSSPIRQFAEGWDIDRILKLSGDAIRFATQNGLRCTYVTEDTTRSRPEVLAQIFRGAIEAGATRLCVCDTVGHATPDGIRTLLGFTQSVIAGMGLVGKIGIDWHGHNDRGLGVSNNLRAIRAGADRIHGTALGIGERVGNAALDQTLMNLKLLGELQDYDLTNLVPWCQLVAEACGVEIPHQYPLVGSDAFRTATGVHAAAIIKAERKGDAFLADRVYSSVPAELFGRQQEIEVGPMSGESNVIYWLRRRGIEPEPTLVKKIFGHAKAQNRLLHSDEIMSLVKSSS